MANPNAPAPDLIGGCNFRDIGGCATADGGTVRRGILFRSGVLTYLTGADHAALAPLGIRTIVDLRRDDEIAVEPTTWSGPVRQLSWQVDESIASSQRGAPWEQSASGAEARAWMVQSYATMKDWLVRPLRGLFDVVREGGTPALFHCAAGKDRTGFCAAMVLGPRARTVPAFARPWSWGWRAWPKRRSSRITSEPTRMWIYMPLPSRIERPAWD